MSEHVENGCSCEEPPEPQPLDLAEVEDAYQVVFPKVANLGKSGKRLADAIPLLLAELREARAEIERWRVLPTRDEYACAVGGQKHPDDCAQVWHTRDADEALRWADNGNTGRAWTRSIAMRPWIELVAEPPF